MRILSLGSGSSGNALLIEAGPAGRTKLLIDAGMPVPLLGARLRQVGVQPAELRGVLLTHEHSDHSIGLPLLIKCAVPIIANSHTLAAVEQGLASGTWRTDYGTFSTPEIHPDAHREPTKFFQGMPLDIGSQCMLGDIAVTSFPVSHDAIAPCGYLLSAGGCRICVAIDSGEVTPTMLTMMQQADLLVLESNHDRERLLRGPYPQTLKQRILSSTGHLSNDQAAEAVLRTWPTDSVRWLWLAHLSRTNNTPKLALTSMLAHLKSAQANLAQVHITVLPPDIGNVWDSTQLWHAPSLWEMGH